MDVADFEACAVTAQTAGAQSRQTALVGQLSQRVVLVHELGQRRRTDELLDGGDDRTDVDEGLRSDDALVLALQGHALTDDALHAGEADAELVLQQLTDAADAAVAQMVDVIGGADAVVQAVQIVDGSTGCRSTVTVRLMRLVVVAAQQLLLLLHIGGGVEDLADLGKVGALIDTASASTSKLKKFWALTQPLEMTMNGRGSSPFFSTRMVTRVTPALSISSALAMLIFSPLAASSSPVSGAMMSSAAL